MYFSANGWSLEKASVVIHTEMLQRFEARLFDIAHLEPWLREFSMTQEQ
jgi:hypothetical protein